MSNDSVSSWKTTFSGENEIDFENWAKLAARMLKLDQEARFDVLQEREIDPGDFARAEARWVMALSDDLSSEKMDRADFYAAQCVAEMQRRATAKQETAATMAAAPAPMGGDLEREPISAKAITAPCVEKKPVFAAIELAAAPPPPPAEAYPSLPSLPSPALIQALWPEAPVAFVALPLPPVARAPAPLSETVTALDLAAGFTSAAALPFGHVSSPEFVAEMSAPRASVPAAAGRGETLPLGVDLLGKLRHELPFLQAAVPAAAPVVAWPRLTLDTYASLSAELSVFPERALDILKKYGIVGEAARRGVNREWGDWFSAHPEAQAEWQRRVGEFRAWLLRGGR